jgi:segregation and condensation protein B
MTETSAAAILPDKNLTLEAQIEALLFVSDAPVKPAKLADVLGVKVKAVETSLATMADTYTNRGIRLQQYRGGYQLTSAPESAELVERFLDLEATAKLSKAAVEALAIVAYQQPVTRPQVDSIRGVNSDGVMRSLLNKGLLEEAGRSDGPGRPILYGTTALFLNHFGLSSIKDLPELNIEIEMPDEQAPLKD